MKKKVKYFLVVNEGSVKYIMLESDLSFSYEEGIEMLRKSYPEATQIKKIPVKSAKLISKKI